MPRTPLSAGLLAVSLESFWRDGVGRDLFDHLPAGVCVCDESGVVIDCNRWAAKLWGRDPALADPRERYCGALKFFNPNGLPLPHDKSPMARVLETGEAVFGAEIIVGRPDGSRVTVSCNVVPLFDRGGEIAGAINCFQDITNWKQMAETLGRMQQIEGHSLEYLRETVRSVTHELGSQIAAIMLDLNLIETRTRDAGVANFVERAKRVAQRGNRLAEKLLAAAGGTPRGVGGSSASIVKAEAADSWPKSGAGRPTVLVVDDDADLCEVAADALADFGYDALPLTDGKAALEIVRSKRPIDLMLIDYQLGAMNGLEIVKKARALRPRLKILMMTGHANASGLAAAGRDSVPLLSKPFRAAEFADRIRSMLPENTRTQPTRH